jgi:hypothetical protein
MGSVHLTKLRAVTRDEWIASFAAEAGVERPSAEEVRELLDLAGQAAHASERTAAPLACWIAGRSIMALPELLAAAARLSAADSQGDTPVDRADPPSGAGSQG